MNKKLYIYRASAGSGKTFTLAVEYIKLLIERPDAYKRILAVTFTNKATGEMKERILGQLYGIANALPSSEAYMNNLRPLFTQYSDKEIRQRASLAMEMILHDYGHFRIHTIDAFFQMILRGLARELELSGDMEITLDGSDLLNDAVDLLIRRLTPTSAEMGWLVEYIEEHLANDKTWHVRETIKKFAGNILKEEYQERGEELRKQIDDTALLAEYRKTLLGIKNDIIGRTRALGKSFFRIAEAKGLTVDDFYFKNSGIWSHFAKLDNGVLQPLGARAQQCLENPSKISTKLSAAECDEIAALLAENREIADKELKTLNNCTLSLARFHQLRLLNSIGKTLQEENTRENRFLLAQTTYLLNKMIDNDTAFIFEKIGSEISHIFIDEFQDTSKLQWQCFKVLLQEVMAHGTTNLIVGDVKQSIYRWRNSDWNILNRIEEEFHKESIANYTSTAGNNPLQTTNYRSDKRVVTFNNAMFSTATRIIDESYREDLGERLADLKKAYNDVEQAVPNGKAERGYVEMRMIDAKNKEKSFEETVHTRLMATLKELLCIRGVKPSDITILVRTKNVATEIARIFNETFGEEFSIISDEAYRLSSSSAIEIIISALRHISQPDDKINLLHLAKMYCERVKGITLSPSELFGMKNHTQLLPAEFVEEVPQLGEMPVYELLERLIVIFGLSTIKGEEAFIYSFLDHASQNLNNKASDINSFLELWDEELNKKSIPAGDTDSVRIMTIHKSKGLEFHTVIIPFATWKLAGDNRNLIWCTPKEEPFNNLSLLPIDSSKKMLQSIYDDDYNHEYLFQLVDNLNLLYVACTRASSNLFIFADANANKDNISNLLATVVRNLSLHGATFFEEEQLFTYGQIVASHNKKNEKSDNPFTDRPQNLKQPFTSYENRLSFRQSHNLARFLAKNKEEEERLEYLAQGELLHELLSKLNTGKELERQMTKLQMEGLIDSGKEYNNIKRIMQRALANPKASEWFSGKYRLYNECTILFKDGKKHEQRRPDRVMVLNGEATVVDFKFGKPRDEYSSQVKEYISLLKEMGYRNVNGYIWYVYTNKIEEIKQ